MKDILYKLLFPLIYRIACVVPVKKKSVLIVQVRGSRVSDNFRLLCERLEQMGQYHIEYVCLNNGTVSKMHYLWHCVYFLWRAAACEYIFLDEGSNVLGCVALRRQTTVVQLWHGCGAFKKFGFSIADCAYGASRAQLERFPYYRNTTYVTVSSPEVAWAYQEAMGLPAECICPIGVSRTDVFFDQNFRAHAKEKLHRLMPQSDGKKVILYAPTFRGDMQTAESPEMMDLEIMMQALKDDYVLICKHHPYVKKTPLIPETCNIFARDLTNIMSIEELLCLTDVCISDYSSLIFEYSLFERPIFFWAKDEAQYQQDRGFYYDYEQMTPGPIVTDTRELIAGIRSVEKEFDAGKIQAFRQKFMSACDGHATERLVELVFE